MNFEKDSKLRAFILFYMVYYKKYKLQFIRNGGYDDSALIGTYCGNNNPGSFLTHSNQFYMKFYTDPYTEARGFSMIFDGSLSGNVCNVIFRNPQFSLFIAFTNLKIFSLGCGGTLTSANGYFQSPNYPYPYNQNSECFWLIKVSEGSSVLLSFTDFDLQTHGYCEFDYVEVSAIINFFNLEKFKDLKTS